MMAGVVAVVLVLNVDISVAVAVRRWPAVAVTPAGGVSVMVTTPPTIVPLPPVTEVTAPVPLVVASTVPRKKRPCAVSPALLR